MEAWDALGDLLNAGKSWSGHESNCLFLNMRGQGFARGSSVLGFDSDDDSRGLALTDWDQDGDLDIWMSSRTAPRLRFYENRASDGKRFIQFDLEGVQSNRDGIGATLVLNFGEGESIPPMVRSLRAGEGFLAQSSKRVSFGLGDQARPISVTVKWPGGENETFAVAEIDRVYKLKQGTGAAERQSPRAIIALEEEGLPQSEAKGGMAARVIPHAPLIFPDFEIPMNAGAKRSLSGFRGKFVLMSLWASWCAPCMAELVELNRRAEELAAHDVEILLINVESLTEPLERRANAAAVVLEREGLRFESGFADDLLLSLFETAESTIVGRPRPIGTPSSYLFDSEGRWIAMYRGGVSVDQILKDLTFAATPPSEARDFATPFAGSWYVNPFAPDMDALPVALEAVDEGLAISCMERVLAIDPTNEELAPRLGLAYERRGAVARALEIYENLLRARPDGISAASRIAWILATTQNESIRDVDRAVEIATDLVRRTDASVAELLEILAAAQASSGDFAAAMESEELALNAYQATGNRGRVDRANRRMEQFKSQRPIRE